MTWRVPKSSALTCCVAVLAASLLAGCGSPSAANIVLRKQNQALTRQVDELKRQHAGDVASFAASQKPGSTRPIVSPGQLDTLFTVHGLTLGPLTAGNNPDARATRDSQLLVYALPTDDDGDAIKAAGSFQVQAYDLAIPGHPLLGQWQFNTVDSRKLFYAHLSLYTYVLPCPWQSPPTHAKLLVRVNFTDAFTGRSFSAHRDVSVRPPG